MDDDARAAIESRLSPVALIFIDDHCDRHGITRHTWTEEPYLKFLVREAVGQMLLEFEERGVSDKRALRETAVLLGIPAETIRSWTRAELGGGKPYHLRAKAAKR